MKKIISYIIILVFSSSFYLMPALDAITLGEIKTDKKEDTVKEDKKDTGQKKDDSTKKQNGDKKETKKDNDTSQKKDDDKKNIDEKKNVDEVNPRLVCLLSVIMPGGGHFYLNNDTKGLAFCLAAGVGYTVSGFFMIKTMLADRGSVEYKNYLLLTGFLFFITLIIHFVGIIEAYSDAEEMNKKNLFKGSDDPYNSDIVTE